MNLILCGLPGCGKSSLGKWIARHQALPFIDTDREIEAFYASTSGDLISCRHIYQKIGETPFRELEHTVLAQLKPKESCVIAIGGGMLFFPANIPLLKQLGTLIYLKKDTRTLFENSMANGLPAYLDPHHPQRSFEQLVQTRFPIYEEACDLKLETSQLSIEEIYLQLLNNIRGLWLATPLEKSLESPLGENPMEKQLASSSMDVQPD